MNFQGTVKILAGTFKTWQQLIATAMAARDYGTADQNARAVSMVRGQSAVRVRFKPAGDIYVADAWKGNVNGVITQADWVAGDMTAEPGGGQKFDGGLEYIYGDRDTPVELAGTVVYAAADTVIQLNVSTY